MVAGRAIEPTYLPLAETSPGVALPAAADDVLGALGDYNSLLIGCGMGQAAGMQGLVERVLFSGEQLPATVVDADGLNTLARTERWWERFADIAILTPHPGEMARLTGTSTREVQADRIGVAVESAARWNRIVVLKGAHTVVAYPDGRAMLSPFANPGLATAGTGDALAGSIAGLLSQYVPLEDAAAIGVFLHGMAGESVRGRLGDTGMVASDLLPELPLAVRALREEDNG